MCLLLILLPVTGAAFTCPNNPYPGGVVPTIVYSNGPFGTIYVESSPPGAVIYVNGDNKGHAPATVTGLYQGTYTIKAELAGYQEYTTTTTITGPLRSSVYCPLVPDSSGTGLYIMSNPDGADVYVDGTLKGKTPLMQRDLVAGTHTVLIRLSGYADWKSTVQAPATGTKTVSADLAETDTDPNQGINITSTPASAKIILDGLDKGITPKTLNNIAPGIHILEVEYSGYNSWKSTVDVPETGIKEIPIKLLPNATTAPGWITVSSNPGGASVTLDGKYVGQTTAGSLLNLESVTPGIHPVVLSLPGYKPYSTVITVSPNRVSAINATLTPVSGPLAKGALSVYSDPAGAEVFIDNESVGTSPYSAPEITTGDHLVSVRMKGYQEYSASVLVTAGSARNVTATLMPAASSLHAPLFPLTVFGALGIAGFFILRKIR